MSEKTPARLLVVDDENRLVLALCDILRHEGYEATGVNSGGEALAALGRRRFDVLLTDLKMPEMDGITLLSTALKNDPDLIAVVMTAHGTISSAIEALHAGAMDYVLKPFSVTALLPILQRALTVRRLRQENAALAQRVQEHSAELEATNRELESFSYSVSHDLRAPVRTIIGFSDILLQDHAAALPGEARHLLDRIVTGAHRMEELIAALLDFCRLGRQPLAKQAIDLPALVQEVLVDVRRAYPGREVEVRVSELPTCDGDPALLRQVFTNLLSNAFKFTRDREHPVVEIGCTREKGMHVFFIRDNGVGFDQAYAEKVFVVFQRLHSTAQFDGSGVGLSIVQRIVERHGGRVRAEGQPDKGATIHFSLPE